MFRRVVREIARAWEAEAELIGNAEGELPRSLRLERDGFEPLTLERIGADQLAIAHTFLLNGDVMSDPEIVIDLGRWEPVEITMHPVGMYDRRRWAGDRAFSARLAELVGVWARNLDYQKWADRDAGVVVVRHPAGLFEEV
jgi:hypothetical protein